jgi:LacI family transcriptional regulator
MSSRRGRRFCRRLEPRTIIARQSTDTLAAPDAEVAAAVRFIRQNACSGICVKDVLRQVPLSRSLLDQRFCASIGRTPHAEIRAVQLQRAAQLLGETDLPLKQISAACGFSHMEYLSYLFKRKFANSPKAYRQSHRNAGVAGKLFNRNS